MDDFERNCAFIGKRLREEYGSRVLKILLAGSRAKRTARDDSDWDVVLVLDNEPSGKVGPLRFDEKFYALDGNLVEYFRMSEADFQRFKQEGNQLICEANAIENLL